MDHRTDDKIGLGSREEVRHEQDMSDSSDLRGFRGIVFSDDGVVPPGLVEELEASLEQARAGHTVPIEPVFERMRASIARMEAKLQAADDS